MHSTTTITRRCSHTVHQRSKNVTDCHFIGVRFVEGPPGRQANSVRIIGRLYGVIEGVSPQDVADTLTISINFSKWKGEGPTCQLFEHFHISKPGRARVQTCEVLLHMWFAHVTLRIINYYTYFASHNTCTLHFIPCTCTCHIPAVHLHFAHRSHNLYLHILSTSYTCTLHFAHVTLHAVAIIT